MRKQYKITDKGEWRKVKLIQKKTLAVFIASLLLVVSGIVWASNTTDASDSDFSNGITVDSTLDTQDSNVGDTICDDGAGNCTLRAAIQEANSNPDASTINFNIPGSGVHTIQPDPALPTITTEVTINGYSQPGSQENTTLSPEPFDATLAIEIDGSNLPESEGNYADGTCLAVGLVDGVKIRGLIINKCGNDGIYIFNANYTTIQGNYIGTDPSGLLDEGNGRNHAVISIGHGIRSFSSNNLLIGGALPEQRNIISANQAGDIFWGNEGDDPNPSENNTVQGNYIGLGADGETPLPSGHAWGLGNAILLGNSYNDVIGGDQPGEGNVIATSYEYGIGTRDGSSGTVIQGNYIGTDYTGTQILNHTFGTGHPSAGIHIGAVSALFPGTQSHDILIGGPSAGAANIVSGNTYNGGDYETPGVNVNDGSYNVTVQNNYIGTDVTGQLALSNDYGVLINSYDELVAYDNIAVDNLISGNLLDGVSIVGAGSTKNSVVGNSIHNNGRLGISLTYGGTVTTNDDLDPDSGANDLLNFPQYSYVEESSGNTTVDYLLDVPAGDYRIEFFSNTIPDPSGYGEGEEYLGFQNIASAGTGEQSFTYTLTGITGVQNLAMTTTQIDNSSDGFGATSEFGGAVPPYTEVSVSKVLLDPENVAPGATIHYSLTLTQNGSQPLDLGALDGSGVNPLASSVFIDFLPPELSFVGSSNPDITCFDAGANLGTTLASSHADWHVIFCSYTGTGQVLGQNESISTELQATVQSNSDLVFTNYLLAPLVEGDPQTEAIFGAVVESSTGGGTPDFIDTMIANPNNNFAAAEFSPDVEQGGGESNGSSNLSATGQNLLWVILAATASILVALYLLLKQHRKSGQLYAETK